MPMSVLSRVFPTPTYLTMPCIGLDISDTSLKYVSFLPSARENKERKIEQWGDIPIPGGVVQRGQVQEPNQLVAVLKEFKAATEAEFVRISLPEERAYLFETEIKRTTPAKEVRGLLEFRLEENVPIPSREVFFDYTVLPTEDDKRSVQIAVAAYAKETIMQYYEACVAAGVRPVSFEVEAQAMARAVVPRDIKGSVMLVDFGKTRTGIGIIHKGVLLYTSTIDIGGDQLSRALRKVVGEEVSEAELTNLKNTQGLVRGVDSADVYEALLSTVSVIKDELATRMQYWHLRNGNSDERRIGSILLCGGSVNLKGLPAYLSDTLGVPSVRGNVWENAFSLGHTVPPIERRQSFGYATAIGLALQNTA
ncbi:MAG: pilus assembly protein PilM [Candidatus Pacebacteria bacterium]|jgi:type IV pilus assembly protein PilM|nr:pilus assembly protein PilM [Candidatus Paceibacterota bacterium]